MNIVDQAFQTQLNNIQKKTGRTLDQLSEIMRSSGLSKHGDIRDMLKRDLALGHGDANTLTHYYLGHAGFTRAASGAPLPDRDDALAAIYIGPKAVLRPIHDRLMSAIQDFGAFEVSPKKGYVSLRRKKQFAMVGPATNTRVEVGLNMKDIEPTERLAAEKPGGMCQYKVKLTEVSGVDDELLGWMKRAYDSAG